MTDEPRQCPQHVRNLFAGSTDQGDEPEDKDRGDKRETNGTSKQHTASSDRLRTAGL